MFDDLLNELRSNPRLRSGIALIIGIFWLYGLLVLNETLHEENQRNQAATQTRARLQALLAQPEWQSRAMAAQATAVQLEGRLWQAPTTGLAQAAFQDWLSATMIQAGIARPQIAVTVADEIAPVASSQGANVAGSTPPGLWKVTAKLGFESNAPALLNFLNLLENNEKQIVVATLNVRKEPAPRVEMELSGYFQRQDASVRTSETARQNNLPATR